MFEEDGITYLARSQSMDADEVMAPLQAAASTWRIAAGPRAGRKVLTLVGRGELRPAQRVRELCANAHGFSPHAGVHCAGNGWARLRKRVYDIDIERCARGGKLKLIAVIEQPLPSTQRATTHAISRRSNHGALPIGLPAEKPKNTDSAETHVPARTHTSASKSNWKALSPHANPMPSKSGATAAHGRINRICSC